MLALVFVASNAFAAAAINPTINGVKSDPGGSTLMDNGTAALFIDLDGDGFQDIFEDQCPNEDGHIAGSPPLSLGQRSPRRFEIATR